MTQPSRELLYPTFTVRRLSSAEYTATLTAEDGETPIPSGTLDTLTLRLTNEVTGDVINGRDSQNVLNANNVTVDGDGVLTWLMQPDDNPIIDTTIRDGRPELHIALFVWTWAGGKKGSHKVQINVQQISGVDA